MEGVQLQMGTTMVRGKTQTKPLFHNIWGRFFIGRVGMGTVGQVQLATHPTMNGWNMSWGGGGLSMLLV